MLPYSMALPGIARIPVRHGISRSDFKAMARGLRWRNHENSSNEILVVEYRTIENSIAQLSSGHVD
jgi:hypothetical protein